MELSIITGSYNEGDNIQFFVDNIYSVMNRMSLNDFEIIIVDESTDPYSINLLENLRKRKEINIIRKNYRSGLLTSEVEGIVNSKGKVKIVMDCDLQHNPSFIPEIISNLKGENQCVIMSRFLSGSSYDSNFIRIIISKVAGTVARIFVPPAKRLKDPTSGFYGLKGDINVPVPHFEGTKSLLYILSNNPLLKTLELPYNFEPRFLGSSKIMKKYIFFSFLKEIKYYCYVYNQVLRRNKPLKKGKNDIVKQVYRL